MPKWFNILFVTIMLCACGMLAWSALSGADMHARIADLQLSLETSQGRERKQNHEYAQVSEELPTLKAELAATQPKADTAAAEETSLRAQRKQLRADVKTLTAEIETLQAQLPQANTDLDQAWLQADALLDAALTQLTPDPSTPGEDTP